MPRTREPFSCPVCGEDVPAGARACPECGACEKSGWSDEAIYDGIDLPDDEFEHERFAAEEFGGGARKTRTRKVRAVVALAVLAAFIAAGFRGCWWR
jgi:hypothetical protein